MNITTNKIDNSQHQHQPSPQPSSQPERDDNGGGVHRTDDGDAHHPQQQHPPNAYTTASFMSQLFFTWPYPLLKYGMQHPLQDGHLPENATSDTSEYAYQYFMTNLWERRGTDDTTGTSTTTPTTTATTTKTTATTTTTKTKQYSLRRAIAYDFFTSLWYIQPLMCVGAIAKVLQAYTLGQLIDSFHNSNSNSTSNDNNSSSIVENNSDTTSSSSLLGTRDGNGYYYATILVLCAIVILFEHHHLFFFTWKKGMQLRIACIAAIYHKCTTLPSIHHPSHPPTRTGTTPSTTTTTTTTTTTESSSTAHGQVMNLISNDVERFLLAALFVNYLFWGPMTGIMIVIVGYYLMGYSFLIGFVVLLVLFIPLQVYFSIRFAHYRNQIAQYTDQRVTIVSQAIRGVRMMKLLGYEQYFLRQIMNYRNQEIGQIRKANMLKAYNEAFVFVTNIIISLIIFIIHVTVFHQQLNQGDVFTVFALINILQMELTKHVSLGMMGVSELYVSLGRIQHFLESPELVVPQQGDRETSRTIAVHHEYDDIVAIALDHVTCYWNHSDGNVVPKHLTTANTIPGVISSVVSETDSTVSTPTKSSSGNNNNNSILDVVVGNSPVIVLPALRDITLQFRMGEITAVIGTVGCGKSALLQTIVNELPLSFGTLYRKAHTSIAYAGQDPWIMDGTIRENILLGELFNQEWYDEVISACALLIDMEQFIHADMTIVGDRGVQCSGGQRARIGLARAIYRRADILVVDDPLSAVDTKVGRQLYDLALVDLNVKRGKCVILATHQHQYVHDWNCILMNHGTVQCIGTYDECVVASNGKLTTKSTSSHNLRSDSFLLSVDNAWPTDSENDVGVHPAKLIQDDDYERNANILSETNAEAATSGTVDPGGTGATVDNNESFQEMNHVGTLASGTYYNYVVAMGGVWVGIALLVLFSVTQGSVLLTIVTVGRWSQRSTYNEQMDWSLIILIIGYGVTIIALAIFRSIVSLRCTIGASQNLHNRMTTAVLRTKIQFFDTNPMGRILNRFSADIGMMDDQLPPTLLDFFTLAFVVIGAVATTVTTLPFVMLVLPFLLWYFLSVRRVFVTSTRELKRLEGLARSPIFAMIGESLNGIATIRSNNALEYFNTKFQTAHDRHTRCFFAFIAASRWVGFRMDSLVTILLTMSCYLSVLFHEQGWFNVDPAVLGLSLSMLLQLAGLFQWCVRQSAEVVNQMVSVERVIAFGNVESEAPLVMDGDDSLLASGWPKQGNIQIQDVSVRYRSKLPFALQNVNMQIDAGTRVGIVGRSGSGKSTFMQTLFRLLEIDGHGQIYIDNVDISKIGLHTLRRKISVLPQVPTLFSTCTIRDNLDLLHQYTDDEIEMVIRDCHLSDMISKLPNGYNTMVFDGSFSTGQRQLICLARALLSKNTILILDEATANVDQHTDQLLQQTLLRHDHNSSGIESDIRPLTFDNENDDNDDNVDGPTKPTKRNGTMIAIAHRLETVIDYDKIFVFGNGTIIESGSPQELLSSSSRSGTFQSMVNDTGDIMSQELHRRACSQPVSSNIDKKKDE